MKKYDRIKLYVDDFYRNNDIMNDDRKHHILMAISLMGSKYHTSYTITEPLTGNVKYINDIDYVKSILNKIGLSYKSGYDGSHTPWVSVMNQNLITKKKK